MTALAARDGAALVSIARSALAEAVTGRPAVGDQPDESLQETRASFVTLTRHGRLRGCIGSLEPRLPLAEDVRKNARAAALEDSRFAPVRSEELDEISVEVSVLSPLEALVHRDEADLLAQLRPGVDGLVIAHQEHRGTFLPQVWISLPRPELFLRELKAKAGLAPGFWSDDLRAWRFTVEKYSESA